jgi:hypothetical protein
VNRRRDRAIAYVVVAFLVFFLALAAIGSVVWGELHRVGCWIRYRFYSAAADMWEIQARRAHFARALHQERAATRNHLFCRTKEAAALRDLVRARA